jgi:hypothetical protein
MVLVTFLIGLSGGLLLWAVFGSEGVVWVMMVALALVIVPGALRSRRASGLEDDYETEREDLPYLFLAGRVLMMLAVGLVVGIMVAGMLNPGG